MTPVVVEVGPATVCGPRRAPAEWTSAALDCIDDIVALVDDEPVRVSALWRDLLGAVIGEPARPLVLVVPTWWSSGRIDVVAGAAHALSTPATDVTPAADGADVTDVVVLRRGTLLGGVGEVLVEACAEHLVVLSPAAGCSVLARDGGALSAHLASATSVLIDVPTGVQLPAAVIAALRRLPVPVTYSDPTRLRDAALGALPAPVRVDAPARPVRRVAVLLAGAVLTAAAGGWTAQSPWAQSLSVPTPDDIIGLDSRLLVEGRVSVTVPAGWLQERITTGAGSARVRVAAPGGLPALHITQSEGAPAGIAEIAESLRQAIRSEPGGVFTDLDPSGELGGRAVVSYLERRADSETRWSVLSDGTVRIAVGCQAAPGEHATVAEVCSRAVNSARASN
ncbi:type VII secretion-associated protein [Mycobacterium sp. smrl_JER01]|uniref:type VII secretion-associated protein n=1 Tax=Mycobacterium sp. smrl_JER01 TaxID=3402633 RepID=UPI003AD5F515